MTSGDNKSAMTIYAYHDINMIFNPINAAMSRRNKQLKCSILV